MRPIRLVLRAFGPYADEQVIDFRKLGKRTFFLIHGPTGAGKTSILDGICFALYGDTSGVGRTGKLMRSDHAHPDVLTEVTFDFSIGREQYRITRSPEQERPRKKGEGSTTEKPRATLWKRTGIEDDSVEGSVIEAQFTEVTKKIVEILGFESEQFRQVVMLPQGDFQKFLEAKSDEREKILEILFQTEIYREIQESLKERAKELEDERKHATERREICLKNAEVTSAEELAERRKTLEAKSLDFQKEIEQCRKDDTNAQSEFNGAKQTITKLKEKDEAEAALKALEARAEEFKNKGVKLEKARKALPLIEIESELNNRRKETKQAGKRLDEASESLKSAHEANEEAERSLKKEKDKEPERETLAKRINQLDELKVKVGKLAASRTALVEAEKGVKRITSERDVIQKTRDDCDAKLKKANKALLDAEKQAAKLDGANKALEDAEGVYKKRKNLEDLREKLLTARKEYDKAAKELSRIEKALDKERNALESLEGKWLKGQASVLAQKLTKGKPCPVCGSTDHPAPAHYDKTLPSEAEINAKREATKELEKNLKKAQEEESRTKTNSTKLESKVNTLEDDLGRLKDVEISVLEEKIKQAKEVKQRAEKAKAMVASLEEEITELSKTEIQSKETLTTMSKKLEAAIAVEAGTRSLVTDLEGNIPEELRDAKAVDKSRDLTQKELTAFKAALEESEKIAKLTSKALSVSETTLKEVTDALKKAEMQEEVVSKKFDTQIKAAGFKDGDEFQSVRLEQDAIDTLEGEIKNYGGNLKAASDRFVRAKETTEGLKLPDVKALEEKAALAKSKLERAVREETTLNEQKKQIDKWLKELNNIAKELKSLDERYEVMGRISEVANGKNAQRITFQRFVLATRLDDVLAAASGRLKVMSKGRFLLQRTGEQRDKRSTGGLDLEVYDAHTGKMRPVSTLSGGEGFLASLSLALGLADVVQAYTGGIFLDTLFVDEGFGSLDSEALDLALQTLYDLQTGGRMVAIISHVSDLQERIDARLEVSSTRTGSAARFVIG